MIWERNNGPERALAARAGFGRGSGDANADFAFASQTEAALVRLELFNK